MSLIATGRRKHGVQYVLCPLGLHQSTREGDARRWEHALLLEVSSWLLEVSVDWRGKSSSCLLRAQLTIALSLTTLCLLNKTARIGMFKLVLPMGGSRAERRSFQTTPGSRGRS